METASTEERGGERPTGGGGDGIEIRVNGRARTVPRGSTVADLLQDLGVDARRVAVERNERVVPRAEHAGTDLEPGDVVEVVQFVGGGRRSGPGPGSAAPDRS